MEVDLSFSVILEANHLYDQVNEQGNNTSPICLLLFGRKSDAKLEFSKSVALPILYDSNTTCLKYDVESLRKRIKLMETVCDGLSVCGALLVNHDLNSFEEFLVDLLKDVPSVCCIFTYTPSKSEFELKCFANNGTRLPCQVITNDEATVAVENASMYGDHGDKSEDQFKMQIDMTKKLIQRIDTIVSYLQGRDVSDEILRRTSLLVSQLKKPVTTDMEQALLDKEVELQTLSLLCEQWETAQIIKKVDEVKID